MKRLEEWNNLSTIARILNAIQYYAKIETPAQINRVRAQWTRLAPGGRDEVVTLVRNLLSMFSTHLSYQVSRANSLESKRIIGENTEETHGEQRWGDSTYSLSLFHLRSLSSEGPLTQLICQMRGRAAGPRENNRNMNMTTQQRGKQKHWLSSGMLAEPRDGFSWGDFRSDKWEIMRNDERLFLLSHSSLWIDENGLSFSHDWRRNERLTMQYGHFEFVKNKSILAVKVKWQSSKQSRPLLIKHILSPVPESLPLTLALKAANRKEISKCVAGSLSGSCFLKNRAK